MKKNNLGPLISGVVLSGAKKGRTIGFPTVNLSPTILSAHTKPGVYSSEVIYKNKTFSGALYYGPRLVMKESSTVLEIHILDFNEEIYGEMLEFSVGEYIRGVMDFKSFEEMQKQIEDDIRKIRKIGNS